MIAYAVQLAVSYSRESAFPESHNVRTAGLPLHGARKSLHFAVHQPFTPRRAEMGMSSDRRVVLVHDWLTGMRGGEKCLEPLCRRWPNARLLTLLHKPGSISCAIEALKPRASLLNRLPQVDRYYRFLLPLMPFAVEHWDLSGYDLVLSSSHAVAKGAVAAPGKRHVAYVHTPMRYAWDMQDAYLEQTGWSAPKRWLAHRALDRLRRWDRATTRRVDRLIANSRFVAGRIARAYEIGRAHV